MGTESERSLFFIIIEIVLETKNKPVVQSKVEKKLARQATL